MIPFISFFVFTGWVLILRYHQKTNSNNKSDNMSNLIIRSDNQVLYSWSEMYFNKQSNVIKGIILESIDEKEVKRHYLYLIKKRDKIFEKIISKKNNNKLWKRYIRYTKGVNDILEHQNETKIINHFKSLHYFSVDNVCDGCWYKQSLDTLNKTPFNGLLMRKYEGNKEISEIFTPENRSCNPLKLHIAYYPSNITKYDVTSIYTVYGMNRFFTIPELLYRNRG